MAIPTPPKGAADIGVTGMAVMGSNLARNLARNGFKVAIHNRSVGKTEKVAAEHGGEGEFYPAESMADFVNALSTPRVAIIMVKAGAPTDAVIEELASLMDPGDIIVDCGNSNYHDTRRREADIRARGLHFVGSGVSGGEEGALNGPSIMPGGTAESYDRLGPMLESISAHVDGTPCCTHVGPDGAGHFVKMVHNGIEYADMQLIAEAYDLMRKALGMSAPDIGKVFEKWNATELDSYLIEITAGVLQHYDFATGEPFIDVVLDRAGQKGTGAWTVQNAAEFGVPVTGIAEATFARSLSGGVPERQAGRKALPAGVQSVPVDDLEAFVEDIRQALYASKMVAYSQGFELIRKASILSLFSGADFLKTSTGKEYPGADLRAAYILCSVLKEYFDKYGEKRGVKFSGGIRSAEEAVKYYCIVEALLGKEWLDNKLFRIGASSLLGSLQAEILG